MNITDIRCPHCGQVAATLTIEPFVPVIDSNRIENGLKILIAEYPWSRPCKARILNVCNYENWTTFRDLCGVETEAYFMRMPNFGRKTLNEIKCALSKYGLHIGMISTVK